MSHPQITAVPAPSFDYSFGDLTNKSGGKNPGDGKTGNNAFLCHNHSALPANGLELIEVLIHCNPDQHDYEHVYRINYRDKKYHSEKLRRKSFPLKNSAENFLASDLESGLLKAISLKNDPECLTTTKNDILCHFSDEIRQSSITVSEVPSGSLETIRENPAIISRVPSSPSTSTDNALSLTDNSYRNTHRQLTSTDNRMRRTDTACHNGHVVSLSTDTDYRHIRTSTDTTYPATHRTLTRTDTVSRTQMSPYSELNTINTSTPTTDLSGSSCTNPSKCRRITENLPPDSEFLSNYVDDDLRLTDHDSHAQQQQNHQQQQQQSKEIYLGVRNSPIGGSISLDNQSNHHSECTAINGMNELNDSNGIDSTKSDEYQVPIKSFNIEAEVYYVLMCGLVVGGLFMSSMGFMIVSLYL